YRSKPHVCYLIEVTQSGKGHVTQNSGRDFSFGQGSEFVLQRINQIIDLLSGNHSFGCGSRHTRLQLFAHVWLAITRALYDQKLDNLDALIGSKSLITIFTLPPPSYRVFGSKAGF